MSASMSRRAKSAKTRHIKIAHTDLPQIIDALFIGNHDRQGWVTIAVNDKGRDCVEALFPRAVIAWRDPGGDLPADWHGFDINLPDIVSAMETKLPLEAADGVNLDEATPETLAFLLVAGVRRQGGRAAFYSNGRLEIYHPTTGNN